MNFTEVFKYFFEKHDRDLLLGKRSPASEKEGLNLEFYNYAHEIHSSLEKLRRYEVYFESFYADQSIIPNWEALEHHVHSYLQDFYILKERIKRVLRKIGKSGNVFGIRNSADIEDATDFLLSQVEKVLDKATSSRGAHTHQKTYRDHEIIRSKVLREIVRRGMLPEGYDAIQLEKESELSFSKAKESYVQKARTNHTALADLEDAFCKRFAYLVAELNGHESGHFLP